MTGSGKQAFSEPATQGSRSWGLWTVRQSSSTAGKEPGPGRPGPGQSRKDMHGLNGEGEEGTGGVGRWPGLHLREETLASGPSWVSF